MSFLKFFNHVVAGDSRAVVSTWDSMSVSMADTPRSGREAVVVNDDVAVKLMSGELTLHEGAGSAFNIAGMNYVFDKGDYRKIAEHNNQPYLFSELLSFDSFVGFASESEGGRVVPSKHFSVGSAESDVLNSVAVAGVFDSLESYRPATVSRFGVDCVSAVAYSLCGVQSASAHVKRMAFRDSEFSELLSDVVEVVSFFSSHGVDLVPWILERFSLTDPLFRLNLSSDGV